MAINTFFGDISRQSSDATKNVSVFNEAFRGLSFEFDKAEKFVTKYISQMSGYSQALSGVGFIQNEISKSFLDFSSNIDRLSRSLVAYGGTAENITGHLKTLSETTKLSKVELLSFYEALDSKMVGSRNLDFFDKMISRVKELGVTAKNSLEILNSIADVQSKFGAGLGGLSPTELMGLNRNDFKNLITADFGTNIKNQQRELLEGAQRLESRSQEYQTAIGEKTTQPLVDIGNTVGSTADKFGGANIAMWGTVISAVFKDLGLGSILGKVFSKKEEEEGGAKAGASGGLGGGGGLGSSAGNPMYVTVVGAGLGGSLSEMAAGAGGAATLLGGGGGGVGGAAAAAGGLSLLSRLGIAGVGATLAVGSQMARPWLREQFGGDQDPASGRKAALASGVGTMVGGAITGFAMGGPIGALIGGIAGGAYAVSQYNTELEKSKKSLEGQNVQQNSIVSSLMEQYDKYQQTNIIQERMLNIVREQVSAYNSLSQTMSNNLLMGAEGESAARRATDLGVREVELDMKKYDMAQKQYEAIQKRIAAGEGSQAARDMDALQKQSEKELGFKIGTEDAVKKRVQWESQLASLAAKRLENNLIEENTNLKIQDSYTKQAEAAERLSSTAKMGYGAEISNVLNTVNQYNRELGLQQEKYDSIKDSIKDISRKEQEVRGNKNLSEETKKSELLSLQNTKKQHTMALVDQETAMLQTQEKIFSKLLTMREKYVEALPEAGFAGFDAEFDPTKAAGVALFASQNQFVGGKSGGGLAFSSGGTNMMGGMVGFNAPNAYGPYGGPYNANAMMAGAAYATQQAMGNVAAGFTYHSGGVIGEREGVPPGQEMMIKAMSGEVVIPAYAGGGATGFSSSQINEILNKSGYSIDKFENLTDNEKMYLLQKLQVKIANDYLKSPTVTNNPAAIGYQGYQPRGNWGNDYDLGRGGIATFFGTAYEMGQTIAGVGSTVGKGFWNTFAADVLEGATEKIGQWAGAKYSTGIDLHIGNDDNFGEGNAREWAQGNAGIGSNVGQSMINESLANYKPPTSTAPTKSSAQQEIEKYGRTLTMREQDMVAMGFSLDEVQKMNAFSDAYPSAPLVGPDSLKNLGMNVDQYIAYGSDKWSLENTLDLSNPETFNRYMDIKFGPSSANVGLDRIPYDVYGLNYYEPATENYNYGMSTYAGYEQGGVRYHDNVGSFASGGLLSGPTGGFLAELHDHEVVLNDSQVRNLNLSSADFSRAGVPGFAGGGATGGNYPSGGSMTIQSECPSCAQKRTIQTVGSTLGLNSSNDIQTGMSGSMF